MLTAPSARCTFVLDQGRHSFTRMFLAPALQEGTDQLSMGWIPSEEQTPSAGHRPRVLLLSVSTGDPISWPAPARFRWVNEGTPIRLSMPTL